MYLFGINPQGGFVKLIIILVIAILVLSYLGFDLKSIVESQQNQKNFGYVGAYISAFWTKYMKGPATWIWDNIMVKIVWEKCILVGVHLLQNDKFLDSNSNGQTQTGNMTPSSPQATSN
jgi:hypothetical protein